jgi:hypothetical protein
VGLTAVDPALLIYRSTDWQARANRCYARVERLLLHRRFVREFQQHFAMSTRLSAAILQHFPWHVDVGGIPELRDLRQVILEDFSRLEMIDGGEGCEVELASKRITCEDVDDPIVSDAWEKLLAGCALSTDGSDSTPRIATWAPVPEEPPPSETYLMVLCDRMVEPETHSLHVVWDEDSWHADLALTDWWPDLHRCVLLVHATSPALRASATRTPPMSFSVTPGFRKSLDQHCQQQGLRRSLVEAIAKLIFGVLDKGLGDEAFKSLRRFRVSRFWRVHYRIEKGSVILLEFGPHDMGM